MILWLIDGHTVCKGCCQIGDREDNGPGQDKQLSPDRGHKQELVHNCILLNAVDGLVYYFEQFMFKIIMKST